MGYEPMQRPLPLRTSLALVALVALFVGLATGCGGTDEPAGPAESAAESPTTAPDSAPAPVCTAEPEESAGSTSTSPDGGRTTTPSLPTTGPSTTGPSTTGPSTTEGPVDPATALQQQRLSDLGYWLGEVDGQFGSRTSHAVTAFQKAEGLERTGNLDPVTVERLEAATRPQARSTEGRTLEIDLNRQILLVVDQGAVDWVFDIATGAAATPTPAGDYEIYREIDGVRHAPLGTLYRPKYFNGGIALHGYTSVPPQPASHGCVRLTYAAMDYVWDAGLAPLGAPVWVY
ncbi:MAG: peptidoglycan-binding protein [Acidimicrobiia bacterium]|nr:peptidoglycan-binding protein [Acidimicrobiia bacterium]